MTSTNRRACQGKQEWAQISIIDFKKSENKSPKMIEKKEWAQFSKNRKFALISGDTSSDSFRWAKNHMLRG